MSLDINKLQNSVCIIDGFEREIVDFDIHYNDSKNSIVELPETLITKDITFKLNGGLDPATGMRNLTEVTGYKCRLEKYNKITEAISGDHKEYNWVAYVPMSNVDGIHHLKLKMK